VNDLRALLWVARKDLLHETRSKATTVATLFFSAITLVVLAFAIGQDERLLRGAASGALWVALAFAGVISAAQSYQADLEDGAFDHLLTTPVPRAAVYLGKLLANWLFMLVLGALMMPVTFVLYGAEVPASWPWLLVTLALGTLGFALIAVFYAGLTANLRARESLLPVLMFPVVVPILLAAVRASGALVGSDDLDLAAGWLRLLVGFDLVYAVLCTAIYHFVVEE
jgi:heme exporter protein B